MRFHASLLTSIAAMVALAPVFVFGPTLAGQGVDKPGLLNPPSLTEQAPAAFNVKFVTSAGEFVLEVHRDWAPLGTDRFYNLVKHGFYDEQRFFRVTEKMAVFGIHGDPAISKAWLRARIPDDPAGKQSNKKGTMAFLQANGRRTQTFINLMDSPVLDEQSTPFGRISSGLSVAERLYAGYGEAEPNGKGPVMTPLFDQGNPYLEKGFPKLDYIKTARIVP